MKVGASDEFADRLNGQARAIAMLFVVIALAMAVAAVNVLKMR